ncbi:LAGLIDADG family endonuclease [Halapricum desulfuricans]|uniref:LAGLIDADG family endonuclease n=1 Tax=Halapricum desulfuricans TaxID=2841257 RepID=A0A897N528_9EURY|nr:LAGLIDADG family endonuclease [Halapricum desulfuricans]
MIARSEPVEVLLKHLLPGLELGKHSDEDGFIELMGYVDEIRKHTASSGDPKYDQDYFRTEFGR